MLGTSSRRPARLFKITRIEGTGVFELALYALKLAIRPAKRLRRDSTSCLSTLKRFSIFAISACVRTSES